MSPWYDERPELEPVSVVYAAKIGLVLAACLAILICFGYGVWRLVEWLV